MIKYLAQNFPSEIGNPSDWGLPESNLPNNVQGIATNTLNWILGFVGTLAVAAIIYSGFMYITSAGNSEQAEKAKKNLTWAIIGVVLISVAGLIVNYAQEILNNIAPH